jgi:hypothetical protein
MAFRMMVFLSESLWTLSYEDDNGGSGRCEGDNEGRFGMRRNRRM